MNRKSAFCALLVVAVLSYGGCAFDVTPLSALHSPLLRSSRQREGVVLVRQLVDSRLQQMRRFVGSKTNEPAGAPPRWEFALILDADQKLGPLLTGYVAEALQHAGYETVIQSETADGFSGIDAVDGIIEGQIEVFWLNREPPVSWHSVWLSLSLVEAQTEQTLWQRTFESRKTLRDFNPDRADFELVIRDALDKALGDMVDAFASNEFYSQLQKSGSTAR